MSVANAVASAVSVALSQGGGCDRGDAGVARAGSNRRHAGRGIVVVEAHRWEAGINTIGKRRSRQMAEAAACCVLIRNVSPLPAIATFRIHAACTRSRKRLHPRRSPSWGRASDTSGYALAAAMASPAPAPNQSAHATPAPTRSRTASSGEIGKPEDTGLRTTDSDKNGFVGRLRAM